MGKDKEGKQNQTYQPTQEEKDILAKLNFTIWSTKYFGRALKGAAGNGYENIVNKILNHRGVGEIDVSYFGQALLAAAENGHESIVNKILNHEIVGEIAVELFGFSLIEAASNGHENIVNKILNHERAGEIYEAFFDWALGAAAKNGHLIQLVKIAVFKNLKENNLLDSTNKISKEVFNAIKEEIEGYVNQNEELKENLQNLLQDLKEANTLVSQGGLIIKNKEGDKPKILISPLPLTSDVNNLVSQYLNSTLDDIINEEIYIRRQRNVTISSNSKSEAKHSPDQQSRSALPPSNPDEEGLKLPKAVVKNKKPEAKNPPKSSSSEEKPYQPSTTGGSEISGDKSESKGKGSKPGTSVKNAVAKSEQKSDDQERGG